jgi:hypothetical protein
MLERTRQGITARRDDMESARPGGHGRLKRRRDGTFLFQTQHTLQDACQVRMRQISDPLDEHARLAVNSTPSRASLSPDVESNQAGVRQP